ncbi:MAG TPA: SRPBCC family protein [Acidimicrobiales bacterium]|nr:SRPBCC family protein [Acidimicrobiales bacterium]
MTPGGVVAQRASESVVVDATRDAVFAAITDFDGYARWVRDVKSVEVLERDTDGRGLEVDFRAAAFGRSARYTLRYDYARAPGELSWYQVEGDVTASMTGRYRLEPAPSGTRVTYDLEVELAVPIPAFVKARAAQRIMTEALGDLKAWVEGRERP